MGLLLQSLEPAGFIPAQPRVHGLAGHAKGFGDLADGQPVTQDT
jgi:hypothetical protein